ncbi:MAG: hypothetical protein AAB886_02505, partial [Patescibacteria group bacterium]
MTQDESENRFEIKFGAREILHGPKERSVLAHARRLEHKNGAVFAFADISFVNQESEAITEALKEAADRLADTLNEQSHLQHRFEQSLQALNERLANIIDGDSKIAAKLNLAFGAMQEKLFVFSATGSLVGLYLRRTPKQHFRVFDLLLNTLSEVGSMKPDKLFAAVLDGEMKGGDVLFLASSSISETANIEEIHPLIATLPPSGAIEAIEPLIPARSQAAILIFQMRKEREMKIGIAGLVGGDESLRRLKENEDGVDALISVETPNIFSQIKKLVAEYKNDVGNKRNFNASYRLFIKSVRSLYALVAGLSRKARKAMVTIYNYSKELFLRYWHMHRARSIGIHIPKVPPPTRARPKTAVIIGVIAA